MQGPLLYRNALASHPSNRAQPNVLREYRWPLCPCWQLQPRTAGVRLCLGSMRLSREALRVLFWQWSQVTLKTLKTVAGFWPKYLGSPCGEPWPCGLA